MSKFPKKVKVGYRDYTLVSAEIEDGIIGRADHQEGQITIDPNQRQREKAEVLLHEIIHCISSLSATPERELSERTVNMLSKGILSVWRDNPKVFKWIAEALHK